MMDDKLKELTDLRGQVEGKAKDEAKTIIKEGVKGTRVGDPLVLLEEVEQQYERMKKLYQECIIDIDSDKNL